MNYFRNMLLCYIKHQAYSEYKHSLTFRVRRYRCYDVIATKSMHRLQIRPIVHN